MTNNMETSYKEKYEDILARLERAKYDNEVCDERFCCVIDDLIPELAESEDEKVRKRIIHALHGDVLSMEETNKALAWLEKQGQVKESTISQHEIETCKENNNSLTSEDEKIRKWIIDDIRFNMNNEPLNNSEYRKKAKKAIAWLEKQGEQKSKENKGNIGGISANWSVEDMSKVQRICKYLNEAKKYYADITEVRECIEWLKSLQDRVQPQPKQGWRAEDEAVLDALIRRLKGEDIYVSPHLAVECLESLKSRVKQKQEWSEEDEQHIDSLLKRLDALCRNKFERTRFAISEDKEWLKSLKERIGGKV